MKDKPVLVPHSVLQLFKGLLTGLTQHIIIWTHGVPGAKGCQKYDSSWSLPLCEVFARIAQPLQPLTRKTGAPMHYGYYIPLACFKSPGCDLSWRPASAKRPCTFFKCSRFSSKFVRKVRCNQCRHKQNKIWATSGF